MKRLLLLTVFALVAVALGGFLVARQVAQSSNTPGTSVLMSPAPSALGDADVRDQNPSFSVAAGGPAGFSPADIFNRNPGGAPIVSVPCPGLGLGPAPGTGDCQPGKQDDVASLSYGYDFMWPMKPYWKSLFFSVAPGATGVAGSAVNSEATCPGGAEPQADEFWSSAQSQLNTNGLYYDGNGIDCRTGAAIPGMGLAEGENLDALDEYPAPPGTTPYVFFTLDTGSWSLGKLGGGKPTEADILVNIVGGAPPTIYATAAQLGLQAGDKIDALCLKDNDDYYGNGGEILWFSLKNGSPTLGAHGWTGGDVLAPGPGKVIDHSALGLAAGDDLNALKCAQIAEPADKAVTDVIFDDGSKYPYDGPALPLHPTKDLPYVEVPYDEQTVISVTSVDVNLSTVDVNDALVAFYADIPQGCEGRWYDQGAGGPWFVNDNYFLGGNPEAVPFSEEQLGTPDPDPLVKKPGDADPDPQPSTFEDGVWFQTSAYGTEYAEPAGSEMPITRFFDLGCPTPGQYHFWFCNKIEPKDYIDPNINNNVLCKEMVVESTGAALTSTPTTTATPTKTNTPTATATPTSTPTGGPGPAPQDPTFSLARNGAQVPAPIDPADLVVRSPGGVPPPMVVFNCLAFGFIGCGGADDLDALSLGRDFTLPRPDPANPNAFLYFSVGPGSKGMVNSGVNRETIGCNPEPQADEFGSAGNLTNYQYMDGDGVPSCANPPVPSLGLVETGMPPGVNGDDLDAMDALNLNAAGPPIFFSLDAASPDLPMLPAPSAASIYVNMGGPGNLLYAPAGALGLDTVGPDDIDALCINDADGNLTYSPGVDTVWFSLRAGSASLGANSPADIFAAPYTGVPVVTAAQVGLKPADELDALKCYQMPTPPVCPTGDPKYHHPVTDADGDCVDDSLETYVGTSPVIPGPYVFDGVTDTDGDGCTDLEEVRSNPASGGMRHPGNYWDYYDVDDGSSTGTPGGGVDLSDTLYILTFFGKFNQALDRAIIAPPPGFGHVTTESNDGMDLTDALNNLTQFGASCSGVPGPAPAQGGGIH
jgi:hypothetical protein